MAGLPSSQLSTDKLNDAHEGDAGSSNIIQPHTRPSDATRNKKANSNQPSEDIPVGQGSSSATSTSSGERRDEEQTGAAKYTVVNKAEQQENSTTPGNRDKRRGRELDYELHYDVSQRSVKDVVQEILDDVTAHKNIHAWDNKLVVTPFKKLETVIRTYLAKCSQEMLNDLLIHSSVEEVSSAGGGPQSTPAMQQDEQIKGHFFFSKPEVGVSEPRSARTGRRRRLRGRVICVKECKSHNDRAVLLWVHALCIRLQNEDKAYIVNFIERHLSLKSMMATPYHWQPTSPPELHEEQHQKHYRRVSMSFHLAYLTMSPIESPDERQGDLDRAALLPLYIGRHGESSPNYYLFKASTSTLVTIVIPEVSVSREEETELLRSPQGLWTVLMVNYPKSNTDREQDRHLTPISQFIRGITAALITQRENAESICGFLRHELQLCDGNGLFDDERFTKSNTYHRTIQGCSELTDSIDSTIRYMKKIADSQIKELRSIAHPQERAGVEHWTREMHEELFALRELHAEVEGLNKRAQESRAALHGATAVLEARTALQQGKRLKVLAYLATLYLPLTATSSIYSMSVLPVSASLASSFVVFAILLLLTLSPSIYPALRREFQSIGAAAVEAAMRAKNKSSREDSVREGSLAPSEEVIPERFIDPLKVTPPIAPRENSEEEPRLLRYLEAIIPKSTGPEEHTNRKRFLLYFPKPKSFRYLFLWLFHEGPANIASGYLIPELHFPIGQYKLYRARNNPFVRSSGWKWHPLAFVRDAFRALLLPVWAVVVGVIYTWLLLWEVARFLGLLALFGVERLAALCGWRWT